MIRFDQYASTHLAHLGDYTIQYNTIFV